MVLPSGIFSRSYKEDMAIFRTKTHWFFMILGLALFFTMPLYASNYFLHFFTGIWILCIGALGLNILTGYCGQISIGHSSFAAVGAYTAGIFANYFGLNFLLAILVGMIVSGLVGVIFGLPSLKIKGFYLVMSTLAAQVIIIYIITRWSNLTGGAMGLHLPRPTLGKIVLKTDAHFYLLSLSCLIIAIYVAKNLARGKAGRAFIAIRDNDLAAEVMGVNIYAYKLLAFFIGCSFAGLSGGVLGFWHGAIVPEGFGLWESIWYLGYIIVGGLGSTIGPILGVAFISLIEEVLSIGVTAMSGIIPEATEYIAPGSMLAFGIIIAIFLIFEPRGLSHRWEIFKAYYQLWPFAY